MTSGARRVIFGIKLSEHEAAACDAARGDMPRSEWGRALLLAATSKPPADLAWTVEPGPDDNGEVAFVAEVLAEPGMQGRITAGVQQELAARARRQPASNGPCPHPKGRRQKNGTYCPACGTGGLTSG
jgi:hypothetical protein